MRFLTAAIAIASVATAAVPAFAAGARLSDAQYIEINRCIGIQSSKTMGTPDAAALKRLARAQDWARTAYIEEKADEARDQATRDANRGSADMTAQLTNERDGVCRDFLETTTASTPAHSHAM